MKWIISLLSFFTTSVVVAFFMGFINGCLDEKVALMSIGIGLAIGSFIMIRYSNLSFKIQKKDLGFWSWFVIIAFILFALRSFLWLIFRKGDTLQIQSPHNLGDLALHITYIKYLANGVEFWPDNPILTGAKLRYPIGVDLFNSLLCVLNIDLIRGLVWVGLLSSVITIFALLVWGGSFTLAGFLFNGGLAGLLFLEKFQLVNYQWDLAWKSLPLTLFVTQRGYLFALPVGLLLISSWRQRYFSSDNTLLKYSNGLLPLWIEILFYSSMPLFHMHTFIYLSLLLGFWILCIPKQRKQILQLLAFSFLPAFFFIAILTNLFKGCSIVHIHWGWEQGNNNFFAFWIWNFGLFLPLVLILLYKLIFKNGFSLNPDLSINEITAFVYPSVLFFILFSIVMFHPNNWDNIKLFLWCYLILLPYIWNVLLSTQFKYIIYLSCFGLFFSGFLYIAEGIGPKYNGFELFKLSEVREVEYAVKKLSIEDRFAAYPTYNHPLLFSGHKVVLGYPGHIWVHGFSYADVEMKLKKLMLGESNWQELAKELGVRYIFWGEREKKEYKGSTKPWENHFPIVTEGSWGKVFDIK